MTTSAYTMDGKKRCLRVTGGSGDPRKKAKVQTDTFNRAHRKIGRGLTEKEVRAEAHMRQKEMGDAARAAEMTKEEFFFSCCDNRSNRQRRREGTANDPNS